MDFDALEYHHGTDEHGHEVVDAPVPDAAEERAPFTERKSFFDQITESKLARSLALMAAAAIGGGSLSAISGCSMQEEAQVARAVEKEAKFSTFAENARVPLHEMSSKVESRQQLKTHFDELRVAVNAAVGQIEETQGVTSTALAAVLEKGKAVNSSIDTVLGASPHTQAAQEKAQIKTLLDQLAQIKAAGGSGEIKGNIDSPLYQKLHQLQTETYEWGDALERDIGMLQVGVHGKQIAELANELESTVEHLKLFPLGTTDAAWLTGHPEEVNVAQALIKLDLKHIAQAKSSPAFSTIHEDLGDLEKLLQDLSRSLEPGNQAKFFAKEQGKELSAGQALLNEARSLVAALHTDLSKELATSIGAQEPAPSAQTPATAQQQYRGGGHIHHYHMWYMPFNTYHGGYGGGYSYTPHSSYSYSGVNRLRSSNEYQSFTSAAHDGHAVLGGKEGVTSHANGATSRSVVHGGDAHFNSGASHHPSGSGKVGGFNTGKSFSSGFGG